jgi:hypothetical protein
MIEVGNQFMYHATSTRAKVFSTLQLAACVRSWGIVGGFCFCATRAGWCCDYRAIACVRNAFVQQAAGRQPLENVPLLLDKPIGTPGRFVGPGVESPCTGLSAYRTAP